MSTELHQIPITDTPRRVSQSRLSVIAKLSRRLRGISGKVSRATTFWLREAKIIAEDARPRLLNFRANDICNSRCVMCNIWEQKLSDQISVPEARELWSDSFYSKVHYLGISGGEPTLRKDLPELCEAAIHSLPALNSIGIITNGIREEQILEQIKRIEKICTRHKKDFGVMLSVDGVGNVHDLVRGRPGNFETTDRLISAIQQLPYVHLSLGCTVVKHNIWHLGDVLEYAKSRQVYIKFRIAEFIVTLYNDDCHEQIRNFDDEERFEIAQFFHQLEFAYETDPKVRRTYRNIREMMYDRSPRGNGCPYHSIGLQLNHRGELSVCAPKSRVLGRASELRETLPRLIEDERRRLIAEHCDGCVHDYHTYPAPRFLLHESARKIRRFTRSALWWDLTRLVRKRRRSQVRASSDVLIVGWYGTETNGDRAILWDVVRRVRDRNPSGKIWIASLYPFVTRWTIQQMKLGPVSVIDVYGSELQSIASRVGEVVVGGGPLMHLEALGGILTAFAIGRRHGARLIIDGCGVGPLDRGGRFSRAVRHILQLADDVWLRDSASVQWVEQAGVNARPVLTGDPAVGFVRHIQASLAVPEHRTGLACFLRELPREYFLSLTDEAFRDLKERCEDGLARLLKTVSKARDWKITLWPMHHFHVGGDDRAFARRFAKAYLSDVPVEVVATPVGPEAILRAMHASNFSVCMRFHSVVFCHELGVPYLAVDYTCGGKIQSFLKDQGAADRLLGLDVLATDQARCERIAAQIGVSRFESAVQSSGK